MLDQPGRAFKFKVQRSSSKTLSLDPHPLTSRPWPLTSGLESTKEDVGRSHHIILHRFRYIFFGLAWFGYEDISTTGALNRHDHRRLYIKSQHHKFRKLTSFDCLPRPDYDFSFFSLPPHPSSRLYCWSRRLPPVQAQPEPSRWPISACFVDCDGECICILPNACNIPILCSGNWTTTNLGLCLWLWLGWTGPNSNSIPMWINHVLCAMCHVGWYDQMMIHWWTGCWAWSFGMRWWRRQRQQRTEDGKRSIHVHIDVLFLWGWAELRLVSLLPTSLDLGLEF